MPQQSVASIAVSVIARVNKFMRAMRRIRRSLRVMGRAVNSVSRGMKRMGVMMTGVATLAAFAFGRLLFAGEMLNRKMRNSFAIFNDLNKMLRDKFMKTVLELAKTTIFSAEQIAESIFFLKSAGLTAKQALGSLPVVIRFAQAGMFDAALSTDLLTDAQSALGLKVKDTATHMKNMTFIADSLVRANQLANATVEQFSEALTTRAAASMRRWNIELSAGLAILATYADQGLKAARAGTSFDIIIRDLTIKATENRKAFEALNIAVFDATGTFRNPIAIIEDLERALGGLTDQAQVATLQTLKFQQRSIQFITRLIGMSPLMREYERGLKNVAGAMEEVASRQMTRLQRATERLKATWVELTLVMEPVMFTLAELIDRASASMEKFARLSSPDKLMAFLKPLLNGLELFAAKVEFIFTSLGEQIAKSLNILGPELGKAGRAAQRAKAYLQYPIDLFTQETGGGARKKLNERLAGITAGATSLISAGVLGAAMAAAMRARLKLVALQGGATGGIGDVVEKAFNTARLSLSVRDLIDAFKRVRAQMLLAVAKFKLGMIRAGPQIAQAATSLVFGGPIAGAVGIASLIQKITSGKSFLPQLEGLFDEVETVKKVAAKVTTGTFGAALGSFLNFGQGPVPLRATSGRIEREQLTELQQIAASVGTLVTQGQSGGGLQP